MITMIGFAIAIVAVALWWVIAEQNAEALYYQNLFVIDPRDWDIVCPSCFIEYDPKHAYDGQVITCGRCFKDFVVQL